MHGIKNSRRNFGKILAGTLLLGTDWSLRHFANTQEPYARFYNREIAPRKGSRLMRKEFITAKIPTDQERKRLSDEFPKINGKSQVIASEKFFEGTLFEELNVSPKVFEEYIQRSRKHITDFFSFVGLSKELPEIEFHLLRKEGEIKRSDERVHLYVSHTALKSSLIGNYELEFRGSRKYMIISQEENLGGRVEIHVVATFDKNKVILKHDYVSPIVISAGLDPVRSYIAPPAETLHYVLRNATLKRAQKEINAIWINKNPKTLEEKWLSTFLQEESLKEEGIVHAALNLFARDDLAKIGVSSQELETICNSFKSDSRYSLVPKLEERMQREGCKEVVGGYFSNTLKEF